MTDLVPGAASPALATALIKRIAARLGIELAPDAPIDADASFFDEGGFRFGGVDFDSMDFVEMLFSLEEETGVAILDAQDVEEFDTISKLAAYLEQHADPERIATLTAEWA